MVSDKDFLAMTGANDLNFVNHNETNYDSFKEFKKQLDDTFSERDKKKMVANARTNVIRWERSLPDRWKGAVLSQIEKPAAGKALAAIKAKGFKSFFLHGESGTGKTYVSYAIIKQYIANLYVTPSQVKLISEEALMGLSKAGFDGRKRVEELFNRRYKLYVIDNVGAKGTYREWELELWEQLIEHIYANDLKVIFAGLKDMDSFANRLSDSAYSKVKYLVGENELFFNNGVFNTESGEHDPIYVEAEGGLPFDEESVESKSDSSFKRR